MFGHKNHQDSPADGHRTEHQAVRQYRYLLCTAPADALEAAHAQALLRLSDADRAQLLDTVRDVLMAGTRLAPSDIGAISHLMTVGGRRDPRGMAAAYPTGPLHALAARVISTEAAFGLFSGYAGWDGTDPVGVADEPVDVDFERPGRSGEERYAIARGMAEGGFSA